MDETVLEGFMLEFVLIIAKSSKMLSGQWEGQASYLWPRL